MTAYAYDYENRLVGITYPDGTTSQYTYDGIGRRVQSDEQGAVTRYLYDGLSAIIERGASNVSYTRGLGYGGGIGSIISAFRDGETTYYHYNGIGGVTNLTDTDTNLVESYAYDAFGNILEANGLVANTYGFSTKEYNAKSGLIYFGARYYDPKIGRFITKDPLTWGPDDPRVLSTPNQPEPFKGIIFQNRGVLNPDTIMNAFNPFEKQELRKAIIYDIGKEIPGLFHRYAYCVNNPVLFIDPWGLLWKERAFMAGISIYKLIGPVKVYIRGLGLDFGLFSILSHLRASRGRAFSH